MFRLSVAAINNFILICLLWLIVLFTLYYVSESIYANPDPIKTANVPQSQVLKTPPHGKESSYDPSINTLDGRLASANIDHGRKLFGACGICHIPAQTGPNRLGPNLWQIIGRPVGSIAGFRYSNAMDQLGESGATWTVERLDAFLGAPQRVVKGTIMTYQGMANAQDRADLLLYLRSLSDHPQDLAK